MIAVTIPGWRDACDDIVDETLAKMDLDCPPVDAIAVAAAQGVEVVFNRSIFGRARLRELGGRRSIVVRPDGVEAEPVKSADGRARSQRNCHYQSEATQWAVAHQLGEQMASAVIQRTGHQGTVRGLMREQIASEFAGRLLLPRRWFFSALEREDGNLVALKEEFATASYELILLGMLRWPEWSTVTILEEGQSPRRFCNEGATRSWSSVELEAWNRCRRTKRSVDLEEDGLRVQAWAVHTNERKREFLRTTALETSVEIQRELFELSC